MFVDSRLLPIGLLLFCLVCAGPTGRRSALKNFYSMENGCTGLTNRFLNATANQCEESNDERAGLKSCVARQVGQACLAQNTKQRSCTIQCLQDITHPDR